MQGKTEITVDDYYKKIQEEADKITSDRGLEKITVVPILETELRKGKRPTCFRKNDKSCALILREAQDIVDRKYILKEVE